MDGEAPELFGEIVGCSIRQEIRPLGDYDSLSMAPWRHGQVIEVTLRLNLGPDDHLALVNNGRIQEAHGPTV